MKKIVFEKKHECAIGIMYYSFTNAELVTLNELKQGITNEDTKYTLLDYTDKRKSTNLVRFDYCPYCGHRINWKEIREEENT